ncbi:putative UDP-sugar hydrolase [Aspergillus clavatus NRRL 1]|uniref:2,3-cyclic-nucleotide 2-phosphodiesterase n=1 Tax=Aspergillus clavatus (strain ATCC 1007 / CBS 513.65 / DSM 816 / NCTC 3887 / NRRL 1 / QM 1276 / 107) TaxID=344612 RepID=A1C9M1_ASPCL|nr:2,3-cyclic-nucleotide 2-phosphodiesterase [Aspergillus clavatus NRRL 1]EAW13545.1 2,3-cyclic-nucleotide 2-phosphodiesterase [Aspergillus clavatus NRRL 1]
MVPILNHLDIDVACYGNHDFDFGEKRLEDLSQQVKFPWVLSNVTRLQEDSDSDSEEVIARGERYIIRNVEGYRIGFIGLAGTDWPSNCQNLPPLRIKDPALVATDLARHLRVSEECDFVIAITHMRLAEDLKTANAAADGLTKVDLILAGHDHEVLHRFAGDTEEDTEVIRQGSRNEDLVRDGVIGEFSGDIRIVKSGTNWRGLSIVRLTAQRLPDRQANIASLKLKQYIDTKSSPVFGALPACPQIHTISSLIQQRIGTLVQQPLLYTHSPLDGRGTVIRSSETNLGNMLADACRAFYGTDIALINSGSIRCDRIIEPTASPLRVKDIIEICPFENPLVVKRVSGRSLHAALETSVSDLHVDGRFMQFAGLRVLADWSREEGRRVLELSLVTSPSAVPEPLVPSQMYTVVMSSFIAAGFDGYTCFLEEKTLVSEEAAVTDSGLLLQIFGHSKEDSNEDNTIAGGEALTRDIERARRAIIVGTHEPDGLPVVSPSLDGRIKFVG